MRAARWLSVVAFAVSIVLVVLPVGVLGAKLCIRRKCGVQSSDGNAGGQVGASRGVGFLRWLIGTSYPYVAAIVIIIASLQGYLPVVTVTTSIGVAVIFFAAAWVQYRRAEIAGGARSLAESRRKARRWPAASVLLRTERLLGVGMRRASGVKYVVVIPPRGSRTHWILLDSAPFWRHEQFHGARFATYSDMIEWLERRDIRYVKPSAYSKSVIEDEWPDPDDWMSQIDAISSAFRLS